MRSVADRHAPVQVLVNDHGLPGERVAPARLFELKDSILHKSRVVLIDCAFVLHAKDPIQILAPQAHKRTAFLSGFGRELAIELGYVLTAQELVGSLQIANPTQPEFLRQTPLPGTITAFHSSTRPVANRPGSSGSPAPAGLVPLASDALYPRARHAWE